MAAQWLSDLVEVEMMEMEENELQGNGGFDHSSSGQQKRVALGLNHHLQLHQYPIHNSGTKTAAPALFNCKKPRTGTTTTGWDNDVRDRSAAAAAASTILSFGAAEVPKSEDPHAMFYGGVHVQPKMEVEIAFPGIVGRVGGSNKRMYDAMRKGGGHDMMPSLYSSQSQREREEHILAERRRREILSQRFIALSKIVPGLKKMDKASVLEDAVKYLKYLQHKVQHLEAQATKQTVESAAIVKKVHVASDECDDDAENHSSCDENVITERINVLRSLPEIEAKMNEQTVIIKIHCQNHKGALVKVLSEIEALGLSITSTNVMPFAGSSLDITAVAQIEEDSILSVKDIVKKLNQAFKRIFT